MLSHWHNFALKSGGDQWRRQDLVSGGHDDRGAEWCWVWGGVSAPQPTRGSGGASWALPAGSGAEPRPLLHFLHILGHRTLLVAREIRFSCKFHFQKWWWQVAIVTYKVAPMFKLMLTFLLSLLQTLATAGWYAKWRLMRHAVGQPSVLHRRRFTS